MLNLITPNKKAKAMPTTTLSKIELATQELLQAREKREATRSKGIEIERLLHTLEHGDAPAVWTADAVATREADVRNTRKRLQELKDQLASENIQVDLCDKKLARLVELANSMPQLLENRRHNLRHIYARDVQRCQQALEQSTVNLAEARKVLATKQSELLELERDFYELTLKEPH